MNKINWLIKMNWSIFLVFIIVASSEAVIYRLNESDYHRMPPLYAMDDYDTCMTSPSSTYCVIDVDLRPGTNEQLMKMIQEYSEHQLKHFNHTQIHRGVCVTRTCKDFMNNPTKNETDLGIVLEGCLNNSIYTEFRLQGRLSNIQYCYKKNENLDIDSSDLIMAVVYLVIILLNVVGSSYDIIYCKNNERLGNPYLLAFSVRRNWARLSASSNNTKEPRFERLKLFNGMRTMTMMCVIFSHTTLIMSLSYVNNPLYIETAYDDLMKQLLFNGSLVTHTFFIMSSFLLAYNFMLHAEKHPISWMHLPKGILLRWLRLTPTYALVLATIVTWMRHLFQGPMWGLVVMTEVEGCRQYWWTHLLYFNNYIYDDAFCMPQTWYLAADTQMFCLGLLICILARSCKARAIILSITMVVALTIVAGHTYFEDLDAVVMQSPESYRNLYATNPTFRILYTRGHTNISTYVLGLAGGFLAYDWQNGKNIDKLKKFRWLAWLAFPLGVAVILSGGFFYSDEGRVPMVLRILYAIFYKPVFVILVTTIMLSCVFKLENVYRGLIEWRGFTWTGRVSYSAFLIHTLFQRGLIGAATQPVHMSDYYVMTILAATIFLSYICAALLWIVAEAPAAGIVRAALTPTNSRRELDGTKV